MCMETSRGDIHLIGGSAGSERKLPLSCVYGAGFMPSCGLTAVRQDRLVCEPDDPTSARAAVMAAFLLAACTTTTTESESPSGPDGARVASTSPSPTEAPTPTPTPWFEVPLAVVTGITNLKSAITVDELIAPRTVASC